LNILPMVLISLFIFGLIIPVYAQGVTGVELTANDRVIEIPSGSPSIITGIENNSYLYGKISIESEPDQVVSNLHNFVYSEHRESGENFVIEFSAVMQNSSSTINIIQQGNSVYSLIIEATQTEKVIPPTNDFEVPIVAWIIIGIAVCGIVGFFLYRRHSEGSED